MSRRRNNSAIIVTRRPRDRLPIRGRGKRFFSILKSSDGLWGQLIPLFIMYRWHLPGKKRPERAHHLSPYNADVTNEWSYTTTPPYALMQYKGAILTEGVSYVSAVYVTSASYIWNLLCSLLDSLYEAEGRKALCVQPVCPWTSTSYCWNVHSVLWNSVQGFFTKNYWANVIFVTSVQWESYFT